MMGVLGEAARRVAAALGDLPDWGLAGTRPGQYRSDLAADRVALEVLTGAGYSVMSEESGLTEVARSPFLAVLDPVDGSTNASRGIPWYATSICVLDDAGPLAALVLNQATGRRYEATRGGGAYRDGAPIRPSQCRELRRAIIGMSGFPGKYLGWKQYRALGAVALDLCAVADGSLDGYLDCGWNAHGCGRGRGARSRSRGARPRGSTCAGCGRDAGTPRGARDRSPQHRGPLTGLTER